MEHADGIPQRPTAADPLVGEAGAGPVGETMPGS
jgi:hypothetical protein